MSTSVIGRSKWELDTPALLIDLDAMEFNIGYLARYMRENGKHWRPHAKAHKTPAIAHKQVEAGAIGITCAKLSEAEVMATSGIVDILIGNQVVGRAKAARLAALQRQASVKAAVDSLENAQEISRAAVEAGVVVPLVIEVNTGLNRSGVEPGGPVLELAQGLAKLPGLAFQGLFTWEGFALREKDLKKRTEVVHAALKKIVDTREMLEEAGFEVAIVSAGGTGDYLIAAKYPGITEIEAGGGCFMDLTYSDLYGHVGPLRYALTILSTVVSRPAPDRAVCDAGRKAMNSQRMMPKVLNIAGAQPRSLSAEHGVLNLSGEATRLKLGEEIEFIPGYSDDTMYLYDFIYGIRGEEVEVVWPILARGCKG